MQSMHRKFGKFMKRSADESHVSVLLKDFDDADKLLAKIIESSKEWRDAWISILSYQSRLVAEFEGLYCPIVGSSDASTDHTPVVTPEETLNRIIRLKEEYESLKTDLISEANTVDERIVQPAMDARGSIQPFKKVIRKREDKKLDFERYQGRVDTYRKKTKRSDRDNVALAKTEIDFERASEEYNAADDHLRSHLPGIITATFAILPHLLSAQIDIQNTLLALYYTTLHNYCLEQELPSPPPPMESIIEAFEDSFSIAQREITTISCLAHGKSSRQPRVSDDHKSGMFQNGLGIRNAASNIPGMRKKAVSPTPTSRVSSTGAPESRPRIHDNHLSTPQSNNLASQLDAAASHSPVPPHSLHTSPSLAIPGSRNTVKQKSSATSVGGLASIAAAAAKKKPPPPPPRPSQSNQGQFVTALYDFGGQSAGDLAFREGDRIRVVKKTESTEDWWEGEIRGVKGSFPANYCS